MLNKKMEEALNQQINRELYSGYLYMSMSAYSTSIGLKGFATWFMVQYHEEMFHAMKIYEQMSRRGNKVILAAIETPPSDFRSPLDMLEKTLKHEQTMTRNINELMDLAIADKDHATQIFLQWYVTEQIEEEENDNDIISRLKLIGKDPNGLFMIDKELGARTVAVPTDFSGGVEAAMSAAG